MKTPLTVTALVVCCGIATGFAQQSAVHIDGDDVTIVGCITRPDPGTMAPRVVVWSRGDIVLTANDLGAAQAPITTSGVRVPIFYWLDDRNLSDHVGHIVRIKGEFDELKAGEVELKRKGGFTEIEFDFRGHEQKALVPNGWFGPGLDADAELDVLVRTIDVNDVDVLGPCRP